jgi:hypothetical protein
VQLIILIEEIRYGHLVVISGHVVIGSLAEFRVVHMIAVEPISLVAPPGLPVCL